MKQREALWDVCKALMMLWVVWGHLLPAAMVQQNPYTEPFISNLKIAVNMPVFFAISGLLARRSLESASTGDVIRRLMTWLYPFFTFGIIFAVILGFSQGWTTSLAIFPFFNVVAGGWFVPTLVVVYFSEAVIFRFVKTERNRVLLTLALYLAMIIAPTFRVKYSMHMLPYFVFGLFVLPRWPLYRNWRVAIPCGVVLLASALFAGDFAVNGLNFWLVSSYITDIIGTPCNLFTFFARTFLGFIGIVFVIFVVDQLLRLWPRAKGLASFGSTTLGVYVVHEWVLYHIRDAHFAVLDFLPIHWAFRLPFAIIVFLVFHYLIIAIRRLPRLNALLFVPPKFFSPFQPGKVGQGLVSQPPRAI